MEERSFDFEDHGGVDYPHVGEDLVEEIDGFGSDFERRVGFEELGELEGEGVGVMVGEGFEDGVV